jgi:hypothetical protein
MIITMYVICVHHPDPETKEMSKVETLWFLSTYKASRAEVCRKSFRFRFLE